VGSSREVLAHEGDVDKVSEVVDEVGLVYLEFLGCVLDGVAIKLFNVGFGDLGGLSSRRSYLRWLLLRRRIVDYLRIDCR
jgi:hypothetical protein